MPAPRSVLIDIHDKGLDPQVAHKSIDSAGRIKSAGVTNVPEDTQSLTAVPEKDVKKANKKFSKHQDEASTAVADETNVDVMSDQGAGIVEHKQEEAPAAALAETHTQARKRKSHVDNS